jgi:7,8-dihydropterin-6-yl-methyl-4-(beta-D-ribofuranosyl)aminobenzene 5'-phosphate synthase
MKPTRRPGRPDAAGLQQPSVRVADEIDDRAGHLTATAIGYARMEIVALIENQSSGNARLEGEHGLSFLILAGGRRILFDAGASGALVSNADALGLGDELANLDAIVVSHGHYDHTGGLPAVLERCARPVPVHVRPGFFHPRMSTRGGTLRDVSVPFTVAELEAHGARIVEETSAREILPGFFVTGEIPMQEEAEPGEPGLFLGRSPADATADRFTDEMALALRTERGLVVLVGCAHRGIVNTLLAAQAAAGGSPGFAVLGGAHLHAADKTRIERAAQRTRELVKYAFLGHCTGQAAETQFRSSLGPNFHALQTGWRWQAPAPY